MHNKNKRIRILLFIIFVIFIAYIATLFFNSNNEIELTQIKEYHYFPIYQNEKYGVIDKTGNIIIAPQYDNIQIPNPERPVFVCLYDYNENGKYSIKVLNEQNQELFTEYEEVSAIYIPNIYSQNPYEKSVLKYKQNGLYGIIDFFGKKITKPIYEEIKSIEYKEGELLVKKDGKYGLMSIEGKILIKPQYDSITCDAYYENTNYNNAGYIVQTRDNGVLNGYMDSDYKLLLKLEYNEIYRINEIQDIQNVYLLAYKNGQAGIVKNNEILIDFKYTNIEYNVLNKLFILQKGEKYGVIDIQGQEIIPIAYDKIEFEGIYVTTTIGQKEKTYKLDGKLANEAKYRALYPTQNDNYYISIDENNLYGISDKNENKIVENKYQYIEYVYADFFMVTENGKDYGVINSKDEIIIDFKYANIQAIQNFNIIQINQNSNLQIYNNQMNKVLDITDANIYTHEEYIKVISPSVLKYLDINGKEILIQDIVQTNLMPSVKNSKWGYISKNGEEIIEHIYENVTEFNEYGYAGIKKDGKWGVIDLNGKIVLEPTYYIDTRYSENYFIGEYCRQYNELGEIYYTNNF